MRKSIIISFLIVLVVILAAGCNGNGKDTKSTGESDKTGAEEFVENEVGSGNEGEIVIYSGRKYKLFEPVVKKFSEETGIKVRVKNGKTTELAHAILEEKNRPQADVFLSQEAGIVDQLRREGVLSPYKPKNFDQVDPDFRSPDGSWTGVSGRVRVLMYNKDLVDEKDLPDSVFDLTDPIWKGKVAMASSQEGSVVAWVSSLRILKGEDFTRDYFKGLLDNDIEVLENHSVVRKAVGKGEFAIGIVNHYYYHLEKKDGSPVGVIYPDQGSGDIGTLVNAAGVGIIKGAKNSEDAKIFIDFLITPEAQDIFARENFEYPTITSVKPHEALALDKFKRSPVKLTQLGEQIDGTLDLLNELNIP